MNIDSAFPSNFLKAADLQGHTAKVTMDRVQMEDIGSDHKPVLYFRGKEKGLVLNKTNSTNIASQYGYETDGWVGKDVWLYETMVDFQGRSVPAIRVRTSPPPGTRNDERAPSPPQNQQQQEYDNGFDDEVPF